MSVRNLFDLITCSDVRCVARVLGYAIVSMPSGPIRWAVTGTVIHACDMAAAREAVAWVAAVEYGAPERAAEVEHGLTDL